MKFSALLFGGLLLSLGVSAQSNCKHSFPVHTIVSAPDGVLNIEDEEGARQIKATVYNTPDCEPNPMNPTGSRGQSANLNHTSIGQAGTSADSCEIKNFGGVLTINSFQAVVIDTNGWPLNGASLNFDDIDAGGGNWKEAAVIFGIRNGFLAPPSVELHTDSNLKVNDYNIPAASTALMGLSVGSITVQGAGYNAPTINNCPFSDALESRPCRATFSFPQAVDTIVIMYTLVARGSVGSRSAAFFSELSVDCGCRCRESDPGARQVSVPVQGISGQCVKKESSGKKVECDVLGGQWCKKEDVTEYFLTGDTLPNGNFACGEKPGVKVVLQSTFSPDPAFGGTS